VFSRRQFLFAAAAAAAQPKPHVLLINTDDQRFDTIAALGNPEIRTPALDALVNRGFVFTNLYSLGGMVAGLCLPSRTMLMTGRSVFRIPERNQKPPEGVTFLAKAFEAAGYRTYHHGKRGNTYVPASEAFQTKLYSKADAEARVHSSQEHADQVIRWIETHEAGAPFFIYMAPPVPHDPRVAPKPFHDMYPPEKITLPRNFMPAHPFDNGELKVRDEMLAPFPRTEAAMRQHLSDYYASITCLDHHLGRVFEALEKKGLAGNTLVLFTSDQGLAVGGRHGLMGKQNLYEHFRAPLILAGPGIPKGRSAAIAHVHDLFPTLCDLTGVATPASVEGLSLAPVIRGKKKSVREYGFGVYKDVQRMVRDDRWKLIWYPKAGRFQLFDVVEDPWELRDYSGEAAKAKILARLKKAMAAQQDFYSDTAAPRPQA